MAILVKQSGVSSSGPLTLTQEPYATSGSIYYVNSTTGSDTNSGLLEESPKATVFGASGALASVTSNKGDLVVCLATHRETVSGAYTFGAVGMSIVGKGTGSSRATFTSAVAGAMLTAGAASGDLRIENVIFAASTAATTSRLTVTTYNVELRDCQFYSGANDTADTVLIGASGHYTDIIGCTFTASASGAARAVKVSAAINATLLQDVTVDGQTYGWSGNAVSTTAAALNLRLRNLTLQNYSDLAFATGTTGYISGITADESSSWTWVP